MSQCAAPGDQVLEINSTITLDQPFRFDRHFVRRLQQRDIKPKEAFTFSDATGTFFRASLKEVHADVGVAIPYERMVRSPEPKIDITLACAVLARQRMIFVMQKATELGVTRIVPLLTDHSVPREGLDHENAHSWPAQVIRAARQCRRSSLPEVCEPTTLDRFMESERFKNADARIVLDDHSDSTSNTSQPKKIVLIIGPEGGFSDTERVKLRDITQSWFLGGRILRAETAVLVGLTAVQMTWGDFR